MLSVWSVFDFFSKKRHEKALSGQDDEELFVQRYKAFRGVLKNNNEVLLAMADMQEKASGAFAFDKAYIQSSYEMVSEGVRKIVDHLYVLSGGKYKDLGKVYEGIDAAVREKISPRLQIPKADYVVDLKSLRRQDVAVGGGKLCSLGEITGVLRLPVPSGFAISTSAYGRFLDYNEISETVQERIQDIDIRDYDALEAASREMQDLIRRSQIPEDLEQSVKHGYDALCKAVGQPNVLVAVRSSAIQEDVVFSFAGQYETVLNVEAENILREYKNVLASQFTPRALFYFMEKGLETEQMAMAVGVLAMVDAKASGILYSRDPHKPTSSETLINAVWGLGAYAVGGQVPTDNYRVSGENGESIGHEGGGLQETLLTLSPTGGTMEAAVPEALRGKPCLTGGQILYLASCARKLEQHYGQPQDIEWVKDQQDRFYILQSRPLRLAPTHDLPEKSAAGPSRKHKILLEKGSIASRGVGAGPVFIARSEKDLASFPEGAVLVLRHTYPEFATVLKTASAVVADIGSTLGHLATVAREYHVPALFNTEQATRVLKEGTVVTVDANYANVYEGRIDEILKHQERQAAAEQPAVVKKLREILAMIAPLNLTDPRSPQFRPKGCRTLHDITRLAHEVALRSIFNLSKESHFSDRTAKQLVAAGVPMQWWVIDLDDGVRSGVKGKKIKLGDIVSVPLQALWEGMTAMPWKGPPPVDAKGFLSVMLSAATDPSIDPSVGKRFAEKNYILISKNFCNVSTRLGFHFSTVEGYLGDQENQNYVTFAYTGGGAEAPRKNRRAVLIARLLERYDFRVERKGEAISARVEGHAQAFLKDRLKVLGHIMVHTRQMDMVMYNDAMVDYYEKDLVKELATVVGVPQ